MTDVNGPRTRIQAELRQDGSGFLEINGTRRLLPAGPFDVARTAIVSHAAEFAAVVSSPVNVSIGGADGAWDITVHPDGNVTDVRQLGAAAPLIDGVPPLGAPLDGAPIAGPTVAGPAVAGPAFGQAAPAAEVVEDAAGSEGSAGSEIDEETIVSPRRQAALSDAEHEHPSPALPPSTTGSLPTAVERDLAEHAAADEVAASPSLPFAHGHADAAGTSGAASDAGVAGAAVAAPPFAGGQTAPPAYPGAFVPPAAQPQGPFAAPVPQQVPHPAPQHAPQQHAPQQAAPLQQGAPQPQERASFLRVERREEPAKYGVRGAMTRLGFRMAPSADERAMRADQHAVSQHWPGPRTIAVVNGKGGAGKTPTTVLLSAVFAQYGGAGVLAWDNNQTRGTLGWRTERGGHDATLLELLPQTERLLGTGAQSAGLAHFVHHQAEDKFDVLRSKPMRLAHENRISPEDVDDIHSIAAKFYRLIVIDSGNDESDPMWLRMIDRADQIVVATTTRADHAEAGALLLEALAQRDERSARLAQQSVVVVSQADPKASKADVDAVFSGYGQLARAVERIPFDPAIVDGHLRLGALAPETQRSWLRAAAAVARGL